MIREENPQVLLSLYFITNSYSSSSNDAVVNIAKNYYKNNKENIWLEIIEEKLERMKEQFNMVLYVSILNI